MSVATKFAIRDKVSGLFYNPHSGLFSEKPKLWAKRTDCYKYSDMIVRSIVNEIFAPTARPGDWWGTMKVENIEIVTFELTPKKAMPAWTMFGELMNPETGEKAPAGKFWAKNIQGGWFLEVIGASYTSSPASETYHCS